MIFCYMNFKYLCVHLCVCVCTCVFWHSLMIAKNGETLCAWCVTCVCANYMCLTCFDFSDQISYFVQNFAGIKFQDDRHQFVFVFFWCGNLYIIDRFPNYAPVPSQLNERQHGENLQVFLTYLIYFDYASITIHVLKWWLSERSTWQWRKSW